MENLHGRIITKGQTRSRFITSMLFTVDIFPVTEDILLYG